MTYSREELADSAPPDGLESLRVYVPAEELAMPESIASLEGMPVVVGHIWQTDAWSTDTTRRIQRDAHIIADKQAAEGGPFRFTHVVRRADESAPARTSRRANGRGR